jgi:hypothetical protein
VHRDPRHAEPVVPARDPLGRPAARPVAPCTRRLPLRARPRPPRVPRRPVCGVRRRRDRLEDVTEAAGYGWRFFCDTARSRTRRALLPLFAAGVAGLRAVGLPPSLCLPYLNLLFRKLPAAASRA